MAAQDAPLTGELFVAGERRLGAGIAFRAVDPRTDETFGPAYLGASAADLHEACAAAAAAFPEFCRTPPDTRAELLAAIALEIEADAEWIVRQALRETGLVEGRLRAELHRTTGQLRMFAELMTEGSPHDIRVDTAGPGGSELRSRTLGIGPVAVFAASNFPLAFSVAGGDTASALAAGCPVIVKVHEAHLGVSELVAGAVYRALQACSLPGGVFSALVGAGTEIGQALVTNSQVKAVGFTGSRSAGMQIFRAAAGRQDPIPVFAEMSSVNPSFLLPHAIGRDTQRIARGFVDSLTLAAGQYCTNPGLVILPEGPSADRFIAETLGLLAEQDGQTMLSGRIHRAYRAKAAALGAEPGVTTVCDGFSSAEDATANRARPSLLLTDAAAFLRRPALQEEVFGPSALIVRCFQASDFAAIAEAIDGQLTAAVHATGDDREILGDLIPRLERLAGRIIFNEWPTGVRVSDAMVHGGPFPATTDGATTSVGSRAIGRFLRPVCYQNFPDWALPAGLSDRELAGRPHRVDGRSAPVSSSGT